MATNPAYWLWRLARSYNTGVQQKRCLGYLADDNNTSSWLEENLKAVPRHKNR